MKELNMSTRRDFLLKTTVGVTAATLQVAAAAEQSRKATKGEGTATVKATGTIGTYRIANTDLDASRIAYSWIGAPWDDSPLTNENISTAEHLIHTALDQGINLFDNADIYAYGKCEEAFGAVMKNSPGMRNRLILQTKCGIRLSKPMQAPAVDQPHHFDFSYQHIVEAAEGSLKRLGTDRLDLLLLHRPDALVQPDEVAKAFDELHRSGKVRYFGVSNHTAAQIEFLKTAVQQPLVVNQVQLGLTHPYLITDGLDFDRQDARRLNTGYTGVAGTLEYCRQHRILLQAYSPVRGLSGSGADTTPAIQQTVQLLKSIAERKNSGHYAVALAWLLRHPAGIMPISGAEKPQHIIENCGADKIELDRSEWYSLLYAASGVTPTQML